MSDGNQLADDVPEQPDLSVRFLSFWCCSKYCSCAPSCSSLSRSPPFFTRQCRRHLLSFDLLCLMKLSYMPLLLENDAWENEVLRWIRFKIVIHALPKFLRYDYWQNVAFVCTAVYTRPFATRAIVLCQKSKAEDRLPTEIQIVRNLLSSERPLP